MRVSSCSACEGNRYKIIQNGIRKFLLGAVEDLQVMAFLVFVFRSVVVPNKSRLLTQRFVHVYWFTNKSRTNPISFPKNYRFIFSLEVFIEQNGNKTKRPGWSAGNLYYILSLHLTQPRTIWFSFIHAAWGVQFKDLNGSLKLLEIDWQVLK